MSKSHTRTAAQQNTRDIPHAEPENTLYIPHTPTHQHLQHIEKPIDICTSKTRYNFASYSLDDDKKRINQEKLEDKFRHED